MKYHLEFVTGDGQLINLAVTVPDDRIALKFALLYKEGYQAAGGHIDLMRMSKRPTRGVEYQEI